MERKLNRWVTYIVLALALLSGNILFDLAKIDILSWTTGLIYGTSVFGFFFLYEAIAKFATSDRKGKSAASEPPTLP